MELQRYKQSNFFPILRAEKSRGGASENHACSDRPHHRCVGVWAVWLDGGGDYCDGGEEIIDGEKIILRYRLPPPEKQKEKPVMASLFVFLVTSIT